jgi:hypothetical protein
MVGSGAGAESALAEAEAAPETEAGPEAGGAALALEMSEPEPEPEPKGAGGLTLEKVQAVVDRLQVWAYAGARRHAPRPSFASPFCPGRKPLFLAVKCPARPYKSPIQN